MSLALFYLSRKIAKEQPKQKSHLSDFDKSRIVEGEIVKDGSTKANCFEHIKMVELLAAERRFLTL